jgi:hypothetical protein
MGRPQARRFRGAGAARPLEPWARPEGREVLSLALLGGQPCRTDDGVFVSMRDGQLGLRPRWSTE